MGRVGVGVAVGIGQPAPAWAQWHLYLPPSPFWNSFSPALPSVALVVAHLLSTLFAPLVAARCPYLSIVFMFAIVCDGSTDFFFHSVCARVRATARWCFRFELLFCVALCSERPSLISILL